MVTTDALLAVVLLSYLAGSIPLESHRSSRQTAHALRLAAALVKGMLPPVIAGLVVGAGVSVTLASLMVVIGSKWTPFGQDSLASRTAVALGSIAVISPWSAVIVFAVGLIARRSAMNGALKGLVTLTTAPVTLWILKRTDLYLLYGLALFIIWMPDLLNTLAVFRPGRRRAWVSLLLSVVLVGSAALYIVDRYVYSGFGFQDEIIRVGSRELPFVALTFDDGPDPKYTPKILDILGEYGVRATFFVLGDKVRRYPDIVLRIDEEGHDLGVHGYYHKNLLGASRATVESEILQGKQVLFEVLQKETQLYRPPRGLYTSLVLNILRDTGDALVLWTNTSRDWMETGKNSIVRNVVGSIAPGDIILMHDSGSLLASTGGNRDNTVAALPDIIRQVRAKGLEFLTMSEMIILSSILDTTPDPEDEAEVLDDAVY